MPRLEPALFDHLQVEFGDHGSRAVGFLETAQGLLDTGAAPVSRLGELVAYCIREALTEIPKASADSSRRRLGDLSETVVKAAKRYRMAVELPGGDNAGALGELLSRVDNVEGFLRDEKGVHEARLIAVMIQRAGVAPLSSGTEPVHAYQKLVDRVNRALHGSCTVDDARECWSECVALLRQLFLPPELRHQELDELALLETPSPTDLEEVLRLAGTRNHLRRFLGKVSSPRWLWLLDSSDVLNAGGNELWWSAGSASVRLADTHRGEVVSWLGEMHDKHVNVLKRVRAIAHAAYRLGGPALDVLLKIVRRYPTDDRVVFSGREAALALDASDQMVADLADVLMNKASWDRLIVPERLVAHVVDGVDERNALGRIKLLCFKLNKVSDNDLVLSHFRYDPSGLIADGHSLFPDDRSSVLLGCLTKAVRAAWAWLPASDLLDSTSGLPPPVVARVRAWILAHAPDVNPGALVEELEEAIASREATGDDIALIDRAVDSCDRTVLGNCVTTALGDVPTVGEVSRALGSELPLPERWTRAHAWVAVLPADLTEPWQVPGQVLTASYGTLHRDDLLRSEPAEGGYVGSPIGAEELRSMPPEQAAEMIVQWRPGPTDWNVSALQLARTIQTLAKEDPRGWLSEPVHIAAKLHEPIYISHYLQAAAELVGDTTMPVAGLLDVIQMVWPEPWSPAPLGERFNYVHSWRGAKRSAVSLIQALANADADFGDRSDEAWKIIDSAARDLSEPSLMSDGGDPLSRAINRSCTRAFETAILFVAAELRACRPARPAFEDLLGFGLRLEGRDGAEYRAVLAPRVAWLRHQLSEWTEAHLDALFGTEAPAGLAQTTIDMTIKWGQPNPWLLEAYPEMIQDAATRRTERAMRHLLLGMLWNLSGYQIDSVVRFLETNPELVSDTGAQLGSLLDGDEADPHHVEVAADLWEALLESEAAPSLEGFGCMSRVTALDTNQWAELTLTTIQKTGGRIQWDHQVADRAMSQPATTTKLAVLNQLIRGQPDHHWTLRRIADNIGDYLATATNLETTVEYQQLRTALLERGIIDN